MNINNKIYKFIELIRQNTIYRRLILLFLDVIIISISWIITLLISFSENLIDFNLIYIWVLVSYLLIGIPIYFFSGQYKGISSHIGSFSFQNIIKRNLLISILSLIFGFVSKFNIPELSFWLIFCFSIVNLKILIRNLIKNYLLRQNNLKKKIPRVAIYGAGNAGALLSSALNQAKSHKIIFFIDDNPTLENRNIDGINIINKISLKNHISKIDQILIAIPSLSRSKKLKIIRELQSYKIKILQIPGILELTEEKVKINDLKPIQVEDLLLREKVGFKDNYLGEIINKKVICIVGAGGSIGSELCRQILKFMPLKLVIIDNHEFSLYQIELELNHLLKKQIKLVSYLCDAKEYQFISEILSENNVDIVFHAAAYKHVPLVEKNPLQGILNNFISTKVICEASKKNQVKNMILISSDKAVRPTNVMGATKRLTEIVVQAFSKMESNTIFSMVRFGNVLGSSGSVVPLFKKQIEAGGPITITNPNIERYFMTTMEATKLVIQTVKFSKGGEVFLLDMGEPIKIIDLAKQMIKLSGLSIKTNKNPDGDIEIVSTGLRTGEKLYEELLIDAKSEKTPHPLIYKGFEKTINNQKLFELLESIEISLKKNEKEKSLKILKILVPEWERKS